MQQSLTEMHLTLVMLAVMLMLMMKLMMTPVITLTLILLSRLTQVEEGDAEAGFSATLSIQHLVFTDTGQLNTILLFYTKQFWSTR